MMSTSRKKLSNVCKSLQFNTELYDRLTGRHFFQDLIDPLLLPGADGTRREIGSKTVTDDAELQGRSLEGVGEAAGAAGAHLKKAEVEGGEEGVVGKCVVEEMLAEEEDEDEEGRALLFGAALIMSPPAPAAPTLNPLPAKSAQEGLEALEERVGGQRVVEAFMEEAAAASHEALAGAAARLLSPASHIKPSLSPTPPVTPPVRDRAGSRPASGSMTRPRPQEAATGLASGSGGWHPSAEAGAEKGGTGIPRTPTPSGEGSTGTQVLRLRQDAPPPLVLHAAAAAAAASAPGEVERRRGFGLSEEGSTSASLRLDAALDGVFEEAVEAVDGGGTEREAHVADSTPTNNDEKENEKTDSPPSARTASAARLEQAPHEADGSGFVEHSADNTGEPGIQQHVRYAAAAAPAAARVEHAWAADHVPGQELKGFGEGLFDGEDAAMTYQARQRSRLYEIQQLKASLEQTEVREYAEELEHVDLGSNAVTIASVSKAQLAEQQRALDEERERLRVEQRRLHRRRQDILSRQEAEAMAAVATERAALAHERVEVEEERLAKDRTRARTIRNALRAAQHSMVRGLRARGLKLKEQLGVLQVDTSGGRQLLAGARQWRLSAALSSAPRPIKIRIDTCRALRDKVHRGQYVVVATLLERLGGEPLRYAGVGAERLTSTRTRPVAFGGRHADCDLLFDECLFLLCPPDAELNASLTLLFEVYECKSRLTPTDTCVAWSVFPLVTAGFEVVSGKFKAPLIRGEYLPQLQQHRSIEEYYAGDLDRWLGNMYFKISRMSRYLHNSSEYALRLQYTSQLLGLAPPLVNAGGASEQGAGGGVQESPEGGASHSGRAGGGGRAEAAGSGSLSLSIDVQDAGGWRVGGGL